MATQPRSRTDDLSNLTPYEFEPLHSQQHVRILAVNPGPPEQDVIQCSLDMVKDPKDERHNYDDLDLEHHGYEALSWCWGDGDPDHSIRIQKGSEDYCFKVSEHLYEALRALRDNQHIRYLWVDHICINQENIEERNQQVAKMNEIYGEARNVCIWLGRADEVSKLALEFIRVRLRHVYSFDHLRRDKEHIRSWAAMLAFMKKPWFERRWVVQEVSLAKQATVHCGSDHVSWDELGSAISLFVDVDNSMRQLSALARKEESFGHVDDFFKEVPALGATSLVNLTNRLFKRSIGGIPQRTSSLEDIVARLASFESTEPRDTIYSLLSLAKDSYPSVEGREGDLVYLRSQVLTPKQLKIVRGIGQLLPHPYQQRYTVDYSQRVVDVYQQFIAFAISRADPTRALDIICRPFAQEYNRGQDVGFDKAKYNLLTEAQRKERVILPSWIAKRKEVPWTKEIIPKENENPEAGDVWTMVRKRGDPFVSTPGVISYCAAGFKKYSKDKVRFRKRGSDYSMFVEGFVMDVVSEVEHPSQLGSIPGEWLKRLKEHANHDPDTLWRILVADRSPKGHAPLYYKNAIATIFKNASGDNTFDTNAKIQSSQSEIVREVLHHIQATVCNRSLLQTKQKFLSLAPALTRPKDLICILYGCSVPVVLRPVEKTDMQMAEEAREDEKDRAIREEKLKPLLSNFSRRQRERRTRRQGTVAADRSVPIQPELLQTPDRGAEGDFQLEHGEDVLSPDQNRTEEGAISPALIGKGPLRERCLVWLELFLESPARRLGPLMLICWCVMSYGGQALLASFLAVLATPHLLDEVNAHYGEAKEGRHPAGLGHIANTSSILVAVLSWIFTLSTGQRGLEVIVTFLMFSVIIPEVVPPWFGQAYRLLAKKAISAVHTISSTEAREAALRSLLRLPPPPGPAVNSTSDSQSHPSPNAHTTSPPAAPPHTRQPDGTTRPDGTTQPDGTGRTMPDLLRLPSHGRKGPIDDPPLPMYYQLVGECYVHKMMHGEALLWQSEKNIRPVIFELR